MSDYLGIIKEINKECKVLFLENFKLVPEKGHHNIFVYKIEGSSIALNRYNSEPVKVLKWFKNFWLYIEVKFIVKKSKQGNKTIETIHTNISISIYQGNDNDEMKIQLFRAEWDDMNDPNEKHSQPHWHITSSQAIEKTFEEYSVHLDNGEFISLLENVKAKIIDVKSIHFAMNGNWQEDQTHIHSIKSAVQISKWLRGFLHHIRIELEEVNNFA
ncbi:hypothetical protein [Proteiniphilum propionicum]|uniref:hypothetical protein n=1 Tax=Proteiniphilum propionicum TaxID=2829812 RepID=UPI001EEC8556|nr:hypothetical protein [Proteiniphilum propionicum]ULB35442.1 hypothetical protein KDN43_05240 [Proteiniphilum propionicum]